MTELEYFNGDELAATTWRNKYAAEGEENPDDMHRRMAKEFARIEAKYNADTAMSEDYIYFLFKDFKYVIPGGSVMSGLGTGELVSLSNCFVLGSPGDDYADIMKVRSQQAQLMKRRGGVGYDMSDLRPRGAKVNNAAKVSTGAASFMGVNSDITNEVAQEGRRGALMLSIDIDHPDSLEFIEKKQDLSQVTGANISTKVSDEFMQNVVGDKNHILRYPTHFEIPSIIDTDSAEYNNLNSHEYETKDVLYYKKVKAKELWNRLMHCAWNTAEPGIMFQDRMVNYSPDGVYPEFRMVSTNPCGEIPMGPYDSCRLIHLNLTSFIDNPFTDHAELDIARLMDVSYDAMRLADDLVDLEIEAIEKIMDKVSKNSNRLEFDLWSRIRETTIRGRRAGLGFTGLADAIAMLGLKYDSEEGIAQVEKMMSIIFQSTLQCSIELAEQRGAFPAFDANLEKGYANDWYKWLLNAYPFLAGQMSISGRRNISWLTVAPTGTTSIMTQTSSGIEPVFLPWYKRRRKVMNDTDRVDYTDIKGEKYTEFLVIHPKFKEWCADKKIMTDVAPEGIRIIRQADLNNEEDLKLLFGSSPYYKSTAPEISWKQRIKLQGVIQKYITHSISSTINLPNETTEEEISEIYMMAWKEGLKGITVYRDGCREGILNKVEKPKTIERTGAPKRPKELEADAYLIKAKGEQFIILVGLFDDKPYEVWAFRPRNPISFKPHKGTITKVGKMHYSFDSEYLHIENIELSYDSTEEKASTLYSSMLLRHGVDIKYITKTAKKVNDNISSFSSAMCRVLSKYIPKEELKGETCPECGGRLVREAGCVKCLDCTYSKCL